MPFWDDGLSLWWISIEIAKFHLNDGINIVYSDNIVIQKNCAALNLYGVLCMLFVCTVRYVGHLMR